MTTHTDTRGNAHHAAGSGRGGQFAAKTNSAPSASLSPTDGKRSSQLTTEAIRESQRVLEKTARGIAATFHIDSSNADDIVQDSWVHLLERNERKGDIAERAAEKAFLRLTARKYGNNYGNDARFGLRSEDFAGRRALRTRAAAFREENGRVMTPSEYETAAGEIRMSFPPGSRPKPDYFREITQLSIDLPVSSEPDAGTLADNLTDAPRPEWTASEDQAARALHHYENAESADRREVKQRVRDDMWRIMSLRFEGAPQPIPDAVTRRQAVAFRSLIEDCGGARTLALAWLDGETTPEQDEALFAPFGDIDNKQRERVVDVLEENPQYADHLWHAGLGAACR